MVGETIKYPQFFFNLVVFYSPLCCCIITFSYSLAFNFKVYSYWIFIGWIIKLSVQTFQFLIIIYGRSNFVYQHLGWTSIYRPLSTRFISQRMRYRGYKTLGTGVIYSPMSPPSLGTLILYLELFLHGNVQNTYINEILFLKKIFIFW